MKKFVIERKLPGAGNFSDEELKGISKTFNEAAQSLGKAYTWVQSFVAGDKIYCIHIAESEEAIRKHARLSKFPIHVVSEVKAIIDPATSDPAG